VNVVIKQFDLKKGQAAFLKEVKVLQMLQ
jgi:serine/threonine protein kinase